MPDIAISGVRDPLQCDPTTKLELWLFQVIGSYQPGQAHPFSNKGQPIYKRLPYNLVSYDGFQTQYIEPCTPCEFMNLVDMTGAPINAITDGAGRCVGWRVVKGQLCETFALNDVDAADNIGQLDPVPSSPQ